MNGTVLPVERLGPGETADDPLLAPRGRYLVGFDGSQASATALRWVTDRARTGTHELVLVGVAEEPDDTGAAAGITPLELARTLGQRAQDLRAHERRLSVSTRLASGDVATGLAQAARPGDVVIVGSDKTGYAQGRLYGFRSIQIAASATGTVVVVPAVDLRMREGVVVGLDDSPAANELVLIAAREAARRRSALLLVHAVPRGSGGDRLATGEHLLARARDAAAEAGEVEVTSHLVQRRPADAILNLSRDRALLVVGRSRRRGLLGVGSTLHELLMNANVPTAVVP
ncbi:universal stress protein [Naasia sp. SYSU D00948]|uniref:universal stress protein n=1 Tax=Naasia sp. SYSU D00948 TaxID=2817379 RepID=UPI001B308FA1|nr:universal stress protein [Naasia sp. SYSU D00948]